MAYFRNPEIKRELFLFLLLLFLAGLLGGFLFRGPGVLLCLAVGSVFVLSHFLSSYLRYQRIAHLGDEVHRFLHGQMLVDIGEQKEGELAILHTEIQKMVHKLNHQAELLRRDKEYLMNSIADISHQIRTPLTALNLIATRLKEEQLEEKRQRELIFELQMLLRHMEWLIQSLLKMAKLDAGTIHMRTDCVPVRKLVEEAVREFMIPMELRRQTLVIECGETVSYAGDAAWSKEAISNIVKNCMEHTPEGGVIRVTANENALYTEIAIQDNGPGIAKKDLPHVFERFYKGAHSFAKSVGIGLALARMIITSQNGVVTAENVKEGGARFVIRFYKSAI